MSPIVGLHATNPKCRDGIRRFGLLPNLRLRSRLQPCGVYVYSLDGSFDHSTFSRGGLCIWGAGSRTDVWQAAYIGSVDSDPFVQNALVFSDPVEPQHVTLITHITGNHT